MIVDRLEHWSFYTGLPPRIVRALEFLRDTDLAALSLGRHALDGDRLFALVQEYTTKPPEACQWEAHRRYCDVQFVARGVERIGVANIGPMEVVTPYDADKDVAFFRGDGDFVTLPAGTFAIFAPHDVHRPGLTAGSPVSVLKIVLKAAV